LKRAGGVSWIVALPVWAPFCQEVRDCDCCGARGSLFCHERPGHLDIHAFTCQRCGKDPRC